MRYLCLFLAFVTPCFASFHLEPYIGVGGAHFNVETDRDELDDRDDYKAVGGKVGLGMAGFDAGLDYEVDTDSDFSRTHLSAYLAFQFPILIRVWGEIGLSSNLDLDKDDDSFKFKNGTSLGAAFTGLPFLHINFEIEKSEYEGEDRDSQVDWDSYLLSVSLPFDFD